VSVWQRPNFTSSPSISHSLDAALQVSGTSKDEIDLFDFYSFVPTVPLFKATQLMPPSCFPIVPKIAKHHLALPDTTPLTLLGGLTSFGGAGNNYSMHALTEMTRQLRQRKNTGIDSNGLVLANGGVMTYQHVVILSSQPRRDRTPYPSVNPLSTNPSKDPAPPIEEEAQGDAIIEVNSFRSTGFCRSKPVAQTS
jgi:hypothetical protein